MVVVGECSGFQWSLNPEGRTVAMWRWLENFREQIRGMNRHINTSKTAAMSSRPIFEGSPRLVTTITQGTRQDLPKKQLLKERVVPSPRVVE
jgi:hypothetical protein